MRTEQIPLADLERVDPGSMDPDEWVVMYARLVCAAAEKRSDGWWLGPQIDEDVRDGPYSAKDAATWLRGYFCGYFARRAPSA